MSASTLRGDVTRRLTAFAWDQWANREALASLQRSDPAPRQSLRYLAHIVAAERLWLARIEQEQPQVDEVLLDDMPISIYGGG